MPPTKTTATPHALIEEMLRCPQMGRAVRRQMDRSGSAAGTAAAEMQLRILRLAADRQVWAYPGGCAEALDVEVAVVDVDAFDSFDGIAPANQLPA